MSSAPDVVVIGAGPAGLAAAAELGRIGDTQRRARAGRQRRRIVARPL